MRDHLKTFRRPKAAQCRSPGTRLTLGTRLQRDERDGPDAAYLSRCGQRRLLQRAPHPTPGTATLRGGPQPRGTATQSPSGRPAPRAWPESKPADGRRPCSLSQSQAELQGLPRLRFPQSADFEHGKCRHVDKPLSLRAVGQASTADRNRRWGHSEGRPQRSPEHAAAGLGLGSVDAGGAGEGQEQRARPEGTGAGRGKRHWTPEGAGRSETSVTGGDMQRTHGPAAPARGPCQAVTGTSRASITLLLVTARSLASFSR